MKFSKWFVLVLAFLSGLGCGLRSSRAATSGVSGEFFLNETESEFHLGASEIDEEYHYRRAVEFHASAWARDLMYIYTWYAKYPDLRALRTASISQAPSSGPSSGEIAAVLRSEFAWLSISVRGALSTFDWFHGEMTLMGSKARLVSTLTRSPNFWTEVQKQCEALEQIRPTAGGAGACAQRLNRDLKISQVISSNASLLLSLGAVAKIGRYAYHRSAEEWVAKRVLPLVPSALKSRTALLSLTAAIVAAPVALTFAALSSEQDAGRELLADLEAPIDESVANAQTASVMRIANIKTEREVFELALWLNKNLPKARDGQKPDETTVRNFMLAMKLSAPGYTSLTAKKAQLEQRRSELESELALIPDVTTKLRNLAVERKVSRLGDDDSELFHKAQLLASLRLVLTVL